MAGVVAVAALALAPAKGWAWGPGGHRVVANIAYDQLDPTTRAEIVKVLRKHVDYDKRFAALMPDDISSGNRDDQERWIFLQAAIWPDLIRPIPTYHRETWHFMNMPYYLTAHDQKALQGVIKPNISMDLPDPFTSTAEGKLNCVQVIKLCMRQIADADTTDEEKALYYCWLLHVVGDSHQPLHSTALMTRGRFNTSEGDRGGNKIMIKQGRNLHSFWDDLLGASQTMNKIRSRSAAILEKPEFKTAAEKAAGQLAPETWIQESNDLAKQFVYDKLIIEEVSAGESDPSRALRKVDLPVAYRQKAGDSAQQRVAEAGYRLAEILKQLAE
jgi:hypothetical protein